jgi:enoyl-CoA hydratase/carnithine racemase
MIEFEVKEGIHIIKFNTVENSFSPEFIKILNKNLDDIENYPE